MMTSAVEINNQAVSPLLGTGAGAAAGAAGAAVEAAAAGAVTAAGAAAFSSALAVTGKNAADPTLKSTALVAISFFIQCFIFNSLLKGRRASFTRTNPNNLLNWRNENLTVTNLACTC